MSSDKFLPKIAAASLTADGTKKYAVQDHAAGLVSFQIAEKVAVAGAAAVTLTQVVDPNSVIDCIVLRALDSVAAVTGTHVGIGDGSDVDRFAEIAVTSLDADGDIVVTFGHELDDADYKAGGSIVLTLTNGSGTGAGTWTTTDFDVIIIGRRFVGFAS